MTSTYPDNDHAFSVFSDEICRRAANGNLFRRRLIAVLATLFSLALPSIPSTALGGAPRFQLESDKIPNDRLINEDNIRERLIPEDQRDEALRASRRYFGATFDRVGQSVALYMLKVAVLEVRNDSLVGGGPDHETMSLDVEEIDLNLDGMPEIILHVSPIAPTSKTIAQHLVFSPVRLVASRTIVA